MTTVTLHLPNQKKNTEHYIKLFDKTGIPNTVNDAQPSTSGLQAHTFKKKFEEIKQDKGYFL